MGLKVGVPWKLIDEMGAAAGGGIYVETTGFGGR